MAGQRSDLEFSVGINIDQFERDTAKVKANLAGLNTDAQVKFDAKFDSAGLLKSVKTTVAEIKDGMKFTAVYDDKGNMLRLRTQAIDTAKAAEKAAKEAAEAEAAAQRETEREAKRVANEKAKAARDAAKEAEKAARDAAREEAQAAREAAEVSRSSFGSASTASVTNILRMKVALDAVAEAARLAWTAVGSVFKTSADFQQAAVQFQAISHFNTGDMQDMVKYVKELSTELPISAVEALELARQAQLVGVNGKQGTEEYVKTMTQLSTVLRDAHGNVSGLEETSQEIIKTLRSMDVKPENLMQGLRDATNELVALKTQFGAAIPEVINMSQMWSSAGHAVGLTATQVLATSAAFVSVGGKAEITGSVMQQFFLKMASAAANGGEAAQKWATVLGVSVDEFREMAKTNPLDVLLRTGSAMRDVAKSGGDINAVMGDLNIKGIRNARVFTELASGYDHMTQAQKIALQAVSEGKALTEVSAEATQTYNDKQKELANAFDNLKSNIGSAFLPVAQKVTEWLTGAVKNTDELVNKFHSLPQGVQDAVAGLAALAAGAVAISSAVKTLSTVIGVIGIVKGAFAGLPALGGAGAAPAAISNFTKLSTVAQGLATNFVAANSAALIFAGGIAAVVAAAGAVGYFGVKISKETSAIYDSIEKANADQDAKYNKIYGDGGAGIVNALVAQLQARAQVMQAMADASKRGDQSAYEASLASLKRINAAVDQTRLRLAEMKALAAQASQVTFTAAEDTGGDSSKTNDRLIIERALGKVRAENAKIYTSTLSEEQKKITQINQFYAEQARIIKEGVADERERAKALDYIAVSQAHAIALAKQARVEDAAKTAAQQERDAQKAQIDAMQDGVAKRAALRQYELADIDRTLTEQLKKYAGTGQEGALRKAADDARRAVDAKYNADNLKAAQDADKEAVNSYQATEKAKVDAMADGAAKRKAQRDLEIADAQRAVNEEAKRYADFPRQKAEIIENGEQKIAAIREKYAKQEAEALQEETKKRLDQLRALEDYEAKIQDDVINIKLKGLDHQREVEVKAAGDRADLILRAESNYAQRAADIKAQQIINSEATAIQGVQRALNDKLNDPELNKQAKQRYEADAQKAIASIKAGAQNDLAANSFEAGNAQLEAQLKYRQRIAEESSHLIELQNKQLQFDAAITVNVAERERMQAQGREHLAEEAQLYVHMAEMAKAQGGQQAEINAYLEKALDLNNQIATSAEESRKAALGEAQAQVQLGERQIQNAVADARSLAERTKAREQLYNYSKAELAMTNQQIAIATEQGRSQSEVNTLLDRRHSLERSLIDLQNQQTEDTKAQRDAQRELTKSVEDFNSRMRGISDTTFAMQLKNALADAVAAMDKATNSGGELDSTFKQYAGSGRIAADNVKEVSEAMSRSADDTSRATEAVSKLKTMYEALKSTSRELASSLSELAGRAQDSGLLDKLETRALSNRDLAASNLSKIMAQYGSGSVEAAQAMTALVNADKAYADAVQAGIDNQVKRLQDQKTSIDIASRNMVDTAGTKDQLMQQIDAKIHELQHGGEAKIEASSQFVDQRLSGAIGTINSLDKQAIAVGRTADEIGKKLSTMASKQEIAVGLTIDPAAIRETGTLLGQTAAAAMTDAMQRTLTLERLAPNIGAGQGNVQVSTRDTFNFTLGDIGTPANIKQLMQQIRNECQTSTRRSAVSRGG